MEDHDERADQLEKQADELEEQGDRVEQEIDDTRSDYESKLGDSKAPGLLDDADAAPGGLGEEEDEE